MSTAKKIVAILTALPGKAAELEALLAGMRPHCRAEPGNLRWDVWHDRAQPSRFFLDELFVDDAAIAAHREAPHFKRYLEKMPGLAERSSTVLDPVLVEPEESKRPT